MPTFIAIGYGDREGYERTSASVREAAHGHDALLRAGGVTMGIAGGPVQVRNHDGADVQVAECSYLSSELPVAGFSVIEAATLPEAVRLVSGTPCAVARGVVEVWPLLPNA